MVNTENNITVRQATRADLTALVDLNRAAYPDMARENIVWAKSHLLSHIRIFPEGQIVAEKDGQLVGAAASLVVNMGEDPYRLHTWAGITDSGYFLNHDPKGDTLYGADVYVHPEARGLARINHKPSTATSARHLSTALGASGITATCKIK